MSPCSHPFPPPWASGFGKDDFGLWAEICFAGVTQRLRWLAPGEFWMGSPEGESPLSNEHPQHLVRLTNGFWLADTACTQAFWLAVVGGDNPSRFLDDLNLPVERVSWNDITEQFLPKLQSALGDTAQVQLPSEAEWEYACRAGVTTPFSFGQTITPKQVNYDGNYPYGSAAMGLYRARTVPVASLPANGWGLYEMHGNVWEWCRDGQRKYGLDPVSDPEGPQEVASARALRGGSWIFHAVNARSASRGALNPDHRNDRVGFRFILRALSPTQ